MTKRMLIDDTQPEETRVVIVDGNKVEDVEFESSSRKQIKGNIYLAKVIRIEPSLQAAFVDYGGNKHGFLAFNEIHPDYYNVSEEVLKEVDAEVDEIIQNKIDRIKEREEQKARYRAEKEAKEAAKRLEAEQAQEIEEAQLEPVQNAFPEEFAEDSENSTIENGAEKSFSDEDLSDNTASESVKSNIEETENNKPSESVEPEQSAEYVDENSTDSANSAETDEDEHKEEKQDKRKYKRYHRRPYSKKKNSPKTMAESLGLEDDSVEDEIDVDDEDEEDFENLSSASGPNFEAQRKLLRFRKLFHRSVIQDVIKEGQVLLIQIVKEERGNKGAACTTYVSLAGRYCVLMPNRIKSGGVSRKITSSNDRKRLKGILHELPIIDDMSLIVRTAGEDKTKSDISRMRFVMRLCAIILRRWFMKKEI